MRIPVVREVDRQAEAADTDTFVVVASPRADDEERPSAADRQPPPR